MKLSTLDISEAITILIYGDPGTGKTEFLASTNTDRAVFFTNKNGVVTTRNTRVRTLYPKFDPFVEVIEEDSDITKPKAFNTFKDRLDHWFSTRINDFDWILIDDSSFLKRSAMHEAIMLNSRVLDGKSKTLEKASRFKVIAPTEADYGTEMSLVENFMIDLNGLCRRFNKNLIVAAHEKQIITKDRKTREDILQGVAPMFTGRAAPKQISGEFDIVLRLTAIGKGTSYMVKYQCRPDDIVNAKDRYDVLPLYVNNLNVKQVLDRIKAGTPPVVNPNAESE